MEIDYEHIVKTVLLSFLVDQKEGRTLSDLIDLFARVGIQSIGNSQTAEHKENLSEQLRVLFSEYKDSGLIYIRSNNLPVPRYVLSKAGEEFLVSNSFIKLLDAVISKIHNTRKGREQILIFTG